MSNGERLGKKKFQLPHIFIILFCIVVLATILTWIIPAGEFDMEVNENGRSVAIAGTYHHVESNPVGIFNMFTKIYSGMLSAADITMLVFITFSSVTFITRSGAFDGLVSWLLKVFKGNSSLALIPIFLIIFGAGSSTVGMFEEWLPFIPVFAVVFIGLGYDAIVGLAVVALGAGIGFSGAAMNPFTVAVAQSIADVPYMSGAGYRVICHVVMIIIASIMLISYAKKVKADPTKSLVYGQDFSALMSGQNPEEVEFTTRHKLIILDLVVTLLVMVYGVIKFGWWYEQITALFVIMAIIAAIIMRYSLNEIGNIYAEGFKDATTAALMIGLARAIKLVLEEGCIIHSIVYGLSIPLEHLPVWLSAVAMLVVQTLLNFFVPSGSGQAALSMPIMAPLADVIGMTRDTAVLAFQFGDGLSNIVWPTAYAAVMSGLANVSIDKWWKLVLKIFGVLVIAQAILLIIAVLIGFGA